MKLTEKNYFSKEMRKKYMSASQFKSFMECEAAALAELNGECKAANSQALFLGSLVDELLTGTKESQEKYFEENRTKLFKKNGNPYADVKKALNAVEVVKKQPLMMKYLSGKHQEIMTGTIAGVEFKIKMDSYQPSEFIADLKYLKDFRSPNLFESAIKYWKYDLQMAVYREIVRQNTGEILPTYLVIVTKEDVPRVAVTEVKPWNLEEALETVESLAPRYQAIKNGVIEPERCGICDYCAATEILTEIIDSDML